MNDDLKTSADGLDLIAKWEGCILTPYVCIAGKRTIGFGHVIRVGENYPNGTSITREDAMQLLADDVKLCEGAIKKNIKTKLSQNQFDALVSFGFNCGTGVYTNSGVARSVNEGKFDEVPEKLKEWSKATVNGVRVTVKGLLNRRIHEGEVFGGVVSSSNSKFLIDDLQRPWNASNLTEAQKDLKRIGLYDGEIDGVWGPKSAAAVANFAKKHSLTLIDSAKGATNTFMIKLRNEK